MPRRVPVRGRRLTPRQAAINLAKQTKEKIKTRRFAATVVSVTDRETTGKIVCQYPSGNEFDVQVRANVDLAADDIIWVREDQSTQHTFVFDGFVKGGGTGNNAADAPIPWTQSPGITSPAGSDLTVTAPAGQTTIIGSAGEAVQFDGDVDLALDELADVNAAAPSDKEVLTWVDGSSEWQATDAGWKFASDDLLVVGAEGHYATVALAIAAAAAGDTIVLDIGTHTCDLQTQPDGVNIEGIDKDACILQTTTAFGTLTAGNGCYIANLTIENTAVKAGGTTAALIIGAGDTCELFNVKCYANNTSGTATGAWAINNSGTLTLRQCDAQGTGAAGGLYGLVNANNAYIYGGSFNGDTAGIYNVASGDNTYFRAPAYVSAILNDTGGVFGACITSDGLASKIVKNTSGGTVAANDVGYIDSAGEFKTTSTAYSDVTWAIALTGGTNNSDIYVAQQGRVTVELNGNCSVGDYLYTSTTAGQAQPQSYMRSEMFAIALTANASGAGGTCSALLHCNTKFVPATSSKYIMHLLNASESDFRATIATLPGGAVLTYNAPASGAEDTIDPQANDYLGKIRLYNEDDADYALIDDVTVGTNTITLTENVPAGWAVGETLSARSQTCVAGAAPYWYDIDLSAADNDAIPVLARALVYQVEWRDTGGATLRVFFHPHETYAAAKAFGRNASVANELDISMHTTPLIQRRFELRWQASGASTAFVRLQLMGYYEATP